MKLPSLATAQNSVRQFAAGEGANAYQPIKEPPLKTEFDEWLVRIVCFAFAYPPTGFVHLANRSIAEQHAAAAEEEGLQPIKQWCSELFNEVIEREFGADDLEFAWIDEEEIDQVKQSEILTRYVDSGVISLNEARDRLGFDPVDDLLAGVLAVKTATGRVPIGAVEERH